MNRWIFAAVNGVLLAFAISSECVAGDADATSTADQSACAKLGAASLQNGSRVLRTSLVTPPFDAIWDALPNEKEHVTNAFCLVEGQASAAPGSDIRFEVWLPVRSSWNGRLLGVGAGGSAGSINRLDLGLGVVRGFASVATDNGHHGYGWRQSDWALGNPERVEDFGYRAHHIATDAAKDLVRAFYGKHQSHSYFYGCSQGGTKGMMAAQRFPQDYDGIVAGSPVYSWSKEMTFQAWGFRALTSSEGAAISAPQMKALYAAAVKQCAGPDGVIGDPRRCAFDPAVLQCENASDSCLTAKQVDAVRQLYQGPRTSAGERINHGLTPGSESGWPSLWTLADADPMRSGSWLGVYRYMVFEDEKWQPASLNFDRDPQLAKQKLGPPLEPDSPDLEAFRRRGGKLLVYHGWGDQMVPAETSTDYHDAVVARMGEKQVDGFFRLFMVPGMNHCVGGPGAHEMLHSTALPAVPLEPGRDLLVTMQQWVEHGERPDRLIAMRTDDDNRLQQTRLLCPEPKVARYKGKGDVLDASAWECVDRSRQDRAQH